MLQNQEWYMIPLKLQLKNFLSYGAEIQTIDFEPYNLICLSGKNGHGKSALLDAMTWALWGQARKIQGVAKADHTLLRLGQKHMMVSLDFIFDGQMYRVRREFALTHGKPYVALDLGLVDTQKDTIVSLTDKTIRATQEKIITLLGLDFDAFANSAFLRQGHANEFSKKGAQERKEILAAILGLNKFEAIRKKALDKVRTTTADKDHYQKLHERLNAELTKTAEIHLQLTELEKQLVLGAKQEEQLRAQQMLLEKQRQKINQRSQETEVLKFHYDQLQTNIIQESQAAQEFINQWRTTHKERLTLPDKAKLEEHKKELEQQINQQQKALYASVEIKHAYLQTKEQEQKIIGEVKEEHLVAAHKKTIELEQINAARTHTEQKYRELTKNINSYTQQLAALDKEIKNGQKDLDLNKLDLQKIQRQEEQFDKRRSVYHQFIAQGNILKTELIEIGRKKTITHDQDNPSCPLCEQHLSAARKRFLHTQFTQQETFLNHRLTRISTLLPRLKQLLLEQHVQLNEIKKTQEQQAGARSKLDEQQKNKTKLEQQLAQEQQQLKECAEKENIYQKKQDELKKEIEAVAKKYTQSLETNEQYQTIKKELAQLEIEAKKHSYDQKQHDQQIKKLEKIQGQLQLHINSMDEEKKQEQRKHSGYIHCLNIKNHKHECAQLTKKMQPYVNLPNEEKQLRQEEQELHKKSQEVQRSKEQLLQEKGSLLNQKNKLLLLEKEQKNTMRTIKTLTSSAQDYQEISKALSKDGIQALLIEDAIPEIEQEANELLGKLTDNQSQIFIESLRDLKKGGTKETLDIKISDAAGLRSYELFSGGEAFRIDFALRIAISKLLARRAGASLQTLIIDEGFGSQDEEGLALMMDAIYKIQDDFAKIIIVSHLSSMKDQFPVHFIVEKNATGSIVQTMQQG